MKAILEQRVVEDARANFAAGSMTPLPPLPPWTAQANHRASTKVTEIFQDKNVAGDNSLNDAPPVYDPAPMPETARKGMSQSIVDFACPITPLVTLELELAKSGMHPHCYMSFLFLTDHLCRNTYTLMKPHLGICRIGPNAFFAPPTLSLHPQRFLCTPNAFFAPPTLSLHPQRFLCTPNAFFAPPTLSLHPQRFLCTPNAFFAPPTLSLHPQHFLCTPNAFFAPLIPVEHEPSAHKTPFATTERLHVLSTPIHLNELSPITGANYDEILMSSSGVKHLGKGYESHAMISHIVKHPASAFKWNPKLFHSV
ncbi:hypothetical protein BU17DRAFT_98361 [Hysterangium stoloniferum]|nr:hypothetical protein BU17DRAFT_98361 [Hysterangium stoloniferum]